MELKSNYDRKKKQKLELILEIEFIISEIISGINIE